MTGPRRRTPGVAEEGNDERFEHRPGYGCSVLADQGQARASLKTTIYAPLTGRVISLSAEEGEVVVSGTMDNPASIIGVIADLSEIPAEVDVDETGVAYLETGLSGTAHVEILDGLAEGDRVVTGPYRSLEDLEHRDPMPVRSRDDQEEGSDDEDD